MKIKTEMDMLQTIVSRLDEFNMKMDALAEYLKLYLEENK